MNGVCGDLSFPAAKLMNQIEKDRGAGDFVALDGNIPLASISSFHSDLAVAIGGQMPVRIDLGPADAVDLSTLQVIVAAHRHAEASGTSVALSGESSPALSVLLERAGFLAAGRPADPESWFRGEIVR